jgi:small-conductance mechanosensitive channel
MGFGIFTALVNLGVQPNTLLAIFGIFVIGIGLSLQTTINNIWAGLYISFNRLYSIGDLIEVNKVKGYVQSFSLFNTIIIDYDKKVPVVIPNTQIQTNVIMNYSVNQIYN